MPDSIQTFVSDQINQHQQLVAAFGDNKFMVLMSYFSLLAGYTLLLTGLFALGYVYAVRKMTGNRVDKQEGLNRFWVKASQRYHRIFAPDRRADLESKVMRAILVLLFTTAILSLGMHDAYLTVTVPGIFCSYFAWRIYWGDRYAAHVRIVVMVLTFLTILPRQGFLAAAGITALFFVFCNGRLDDTSAPA